MEKSANLLRFISKSTHTDNFDLIKTIIAIPKFELAMQETTAKYSKEINLACRTLHKLYLLTWDVHCTTIKFRPMAGDGCVLYISFCSFIVCEFALLSFTMKIIFVLIHFPSILFRFLSERSLSKIVRLEKLFVQ